MMLIYTSNVVNENVIILSSHPVNYYLWLILDSETRFVISFILSPSRGSIPAYQLFKNATFLTRASPVRIGYFFKKFT